MIYVFNFVDRSLLGILAETIKRDLGFSDTPLVGILSDVLRANPSISDDSLRYTLLAARHVARDLARVGIGSGNGDPIR